MYKHIMIETVDNDVHNFFNVKEFEFDEVTDAYRLLSQNNHYHFFQKKEVKRVII